MAKSAEMKIGALQPWFGSSRIIAPHVGAALRGCKWVGVPFAGGMCELAHIDARTIVVSDLHRHVINLAKCIANPCTFRGVLGYLRRMPFHQDILEQAQDWCCDPHRPGDEQEDVRSAVAYFICGWMGRNGKSGIDDEFNGRLSIRWNANGGDSAVRYRNAVRGLAEWHRIMRRCTFDTLDCFEFLDRCEDSDGHGIYCDPPWPDDGAKYRHKFLECDHIRLRDKLASFAKTRVVIRFGVHPLIERLYPREGWEWREITGRTQSNSEKREALILRKIAGVTGVLFS